MMNPSELLLTSSVLILAVLALRHFGRGRLSRRLCYGLWLVVLLRLLVPVSLPSPTSVLNLPAAHFGRAVLSPAGGGHHPRWRRLFPTGNR